MEPEELAAEEELMRMIDERMRDLLPMVIRKVDDAPSEYHGR